jgi:HPt (histidine-containing phosphotransfer) domain-containing protein
MAIVSEFANDPDLADIIGDFVDGLTEQTDQMETTLQASQFEDLRRMAHQLKGAGGSYGYPSITEAARKLEDAAREADPETCRWALNEVSQLCKEAQAGLA